MKFIQDANRDLSRFMAAFDDGRRIGLARFGDGEERIYLGGTYHCSDGWVSRPGESRLRQKVGEAIRYSHPDYYIGIQPPRTLKKCCWTMRNVTTPPDRICDPCLFVNSRWARARKFFAKRRKRCFLVASAPSADFRIPANCVQPEYDWAALLRTLLRCKQPILLAAGPLANVLVMEYLIAGGTRSIIDIGTVLDFDLFGRATRVYMKKALAAKKRGGKKPKAKKKKARKEARKEPTNAGYRKKKRKGKGRR